MYTRFFGLLFILVLLASCGYTLQRSGAPGYLQKQGVSKVYVSPIANTTYKPGVENLVYNQVVKRLASLKKITLVSDRKDADAILSGSVGSAYYSPTATSGASDLPIPEELKKRNTELGETHPYYFQPGEKNIVVATAYSANLSCSFGLTRTRPITGKSTQMWADAFGKTKPFAGNNQIGSFGSTSQLINESEFDKALRDLAEGIAADMQESMLAAF